MIRQIVPPTLRRWVRQFDPAYQWMASELRDRDERISQLEESLSEVDRANLARSTTNLEQVIDIDFIAQRVSLRRKHVWNVAAPKTGSTWLSVIMVHLLGWTDNVLHIDGEDRREQEVDFRVLLQHPSENLFTVHQHCRFSKTVRTLIEKFRVRPIVQGRNVFDCLVSFREHLVSESPTLPMAFCDENFAEMPVERQFDFLADLVAPWYLNFYCTWFAARDRGEVSFQWVPYEELRADPKAMIRRILAYIEEDRTNEQVETALEKAAMDFTRKNVAKVGRGKAMFSEAQMQRVRQLAKYYPHIDLSPVGL